MHFGQQHYELHDDLFGAQQQQQAAVFIVDSKVSKIPNSVPHTTTIQKFVINQSSVKHTTFRNHFGEAYYGTVRIIFESLKRNCCNC